MIAAGPDARSDRRGWLGSAPIRATWPVVLPLVAGITLVAALLGLNGIGERAFWHDEAYSVDAVADGWEYLIGFATGQEMNMVAYYAALRAWLTFGDSDAWIRSLSAIFAAASVPAMYALGRVWLGPRVALWASLLLAVNAYVIEYAQEARAYSLVLLLAIVATALLVRATRGGGTRWWLAYVVAAVLLVHAHIVALGLLPVHALLAMTALPRPSWARLAAVAVALAIGLAPGLWLAAGQTGGILSWIPAPTLETLTRGWSRLVGDGSPGSFGPATDGWPVLAAMLAAAGGVAGWRASGARRRAVVVLVAWVVAPVALGVVVSMVRPIVVTRYFIYLIPAIVLLLALGIDAIPARWPRRAVGVAAVALALSGTLGWYGSAPRPDWRAATAYLLANGAPADRSIFVGDWGRVVVHYARQVGRADDLPLKLWRGLDFSSPAVAGVVEATAAATAAEGRDLWLVVANDASPDPASDPRLAGLWRHYAVAETTAFDLVVLYRSRPLEGG